MKPIWLDKSITAKASAALLFTMVLGYSGNCAAQLVKYPPMTIKIYNNSPDYNIYPVLSSGTSLSDQWIQAAYQVPPSKINSWIFPKLNQYRLYINPTGDGIPPGGSITLTLPLYTQLIPNDVINPTLADQFADWWGGGRIEIFDSPAASHKPPAALTADYLGTDLPARGKQVKVEQCSATTPKGRSCYISGASIPALTTCTVGKCQPLTIFQDPAGLKTNEPTQLTEYTLGAVDVQPVTEKVAVLLDAHNVDYDVSYVDAAYMPAAMEPFNNKFVGYIGSVQPIGDTKTKGTFRFALNKFITNPAYKGWPQFVDQQKTTILKLPSPLHIFPGDPDMTPPPNPPKLWAPIETLKTNWINCTEKAGTAPICANMREVRRLFQLNYDNCVGGHNNPVPETELLAHLYGWAPFINNPPAVKCAVPTNPNLLENTPGYFSGNPPDRDYTKYQAVKASFDKLQYWPGGDNPPNGDFDPYLLLIHGEGYVNAPFTYAYSVDDALGNMQVAGDGLIIAVGGVGGLPNPNHATPPINVGIGYGPLNKFNFTKYGICKLTPDTAINPKFASFALSADNLKDCPVSFVDNRNILYTFSLKSQPPYPPLPDPKKLPPGYAALQVNFDPVDCSGNKAGSPAALWCYNFQAGAGGFLRGVYVDTIKGTGGSKTDHNYVVTPAPNQ